MAQDGSTASGPVSGVAERYASALLDLAVSEKKLPAVEKDMNRLDEMLKGSEDLMRLVRSPVFSADQQNAALGKVLSKAKISGLVANFTQVVANNRRLFAVPDMIRSFRMKLAEHRGEVAAEVTVAHALTAVQNKELAAVLKGIVGKDVALDVTEDQSLLGGMIVKIGSRQIDTSLKTKLSSLKLALKEVG
ncbi:F0F1 ATP synthase subunit delta [Ahrensia sp. R2A130]|uniref:F0F1 ATP synthase subunit delta n=1 Tax=Ahrensia sp. R2A130 TaxID=744979 RepID=UPI0001E09C2D|nr:F0F1 ATP synthase subunit delta [Ahrensia sp. R2A130]EFL89599.1 ATP synthase F1, delta subunit [Ahrensia sp. R2A130]